MSFVPASGGYRLPTAVPIVVDDMPLLFSQTLGAPGTVIDTGANGVPQTYSSLLLVIYGRTDQAVVRSSGLLRLNNDSGANYSRWLNYSTGGTGPSLGTYLGGTSYDLGLPGSTVDANVFGCYTLTIPAYAQTVGYKAVSGSGGWGGSTSTNPDVETGAGTWNNTAAVTRISLTAGSGSNLLAGSSLSIYGLA